MEERRLNCEWGKAVRGGFVGPDTSSKAVFGGVNGKEYTINPPCCVLRHPFWEDRSSLTEFSWDGL